MNRSDLATVMAFKDLAEWNQSLLDWERVLRLNPAGCFACEADGAVAGIATAITYSDKVGCVGTLFVAPTYRHRGIGTQLLGAAVKHLEDHDAQTLRIITPPSAKGIFERMGFVGDLEIERWVLHRQAAPSPGLVRRPLPDFEKILVADREVFGTDRSEVIRCLHADAPDFTLSAELEGEVIGYALGRGGLTADCLGPWVAWDQPTARELLEEFLARSGRDTILVGCPKSNDMARDLLLSKGFRIAKPMIQMVRGPNTHQGRPELICGVLGQEFP